MGASKNADQSDGLARALCAERVQGRSSIRSCSALSVRCNAAPRLPTRSWSEAQSRTRLQLDQATS